MTFNQVNQNAGDVKNTGVVDPMVPILTGLLLGGVLKDAVRVLKVADVEAVPPDGFLVKLASGLVLRVTVDAFQFGSEAP
jgi:hypothetical protein